jgi:hypothetical protein
MFKNARFLFQVATPRLRPTTIARFSTSNVTRQDDGNHLKDDLDDSTFHGVSMEPFAPEIATVLMSPVPPHDVELLPDGIPYLPEIKYRRILNKGTFFAWATNSRSVWSRGVGIGS